MFSAFSKAKSCGFKTVALYVDWKSFYNGEKYNYDFYKIYYKLAEKYDLYVSIIWLGYSKNGFMPWQVDREKYPEIARALTQDEYDAVVDHAVDIGVTQGFIQDGETAKESFIPPFDLTGI